MVPTAAIFLLVREEKGVRAREGNNMGHKGQWRRKGRNAPSIGAGIPLQALVMMVKQTVLP